MTTIRFFEDELGLTGFSAEGHSGRAFAGEDIVCAAVSALTQAAIIGITEVARTPAEWRISEKSGAFIRIKEDIAHIERHDARLILETLRRTLEQLESQYPANIKLRRK